MTALIALKNLFKIAKTNNFSQQSQAQLVTCYQLTETYDPLWTAFEWPFQICAFAQQQ